LAEWETKTDAEGVYLFVGVPAGAYQLGVQLPEEYGVPDIQWQDVNASGESDGVLIAPIPAPRIHWHLYAPLVGS
jgi:hypothetical protein